MFIPEDVRDTALIQTIEDPVLRVQAVNEALAEVDELATHLGMIKRAAVRQMRQTMSLGQVAAALGVTRARVQQLEKPHSSAAV